MKIEKRDEAAAGAATNARLDYVPFSSNDWTDVRSIHNNLELPMAHGGWPTRPSKVSATEKVEKFANEQLLFQSADYEYLEGYLMNWSPPIKVKKFAKIELAMLQKAMGGQKIDIKWPFVMVLGTKN